MYTLRVADQAESQLKALEPSERKRIMKKMDELQGRLAKGAPANQVVEKRLRSPFHRFMQQRVGDFRLWFVDVPDEEVLLLAYVWHKSDAKKRLR